MTSKIVNFIKISFSILFVIVILLFIIEYFLSYFNYPFQVSSNSKLYPIECKKKNDDILSLDTEINNLYHDGGFRNYEYAKNKEGFLKVILDTQCLNTQSIYDNGKMIRLMPFINETYKFNKHGFRGNSWIDSNNANDINVFIMGVSTAFSLLSTE